MERTVSKIIFLLMLFACLSRSRAMPYGPINIELTSMAACHGPMLRNCTRFRLEPTSARKIFLFSFNVLEDTKPDMAKIVSINLENPSSSLMRLQMSKPCEHPFLRPLFSSFFNNSDSCVVRKGVYQHSIDVAKNFENYFAGKFFYGNFSFKSIFYNKKCNFACTKVDISLTPKILD